MSYFDAIPVPRGQVGDEQAESNLRVGLLSKQRALESSNKSVIIVLAGVNGAGSGEVLRALNKWLDQRYVRTYAFTKRTQEELERPAFWRYWMRLPARGNITIYAGAWYTEAITKFAKVKITKRSFERMLRHICQLESGIVNDGSIVLKYWLHLNATQQSERFDHLLANKDTAWRVTKDDIKSKKYHHAFVAGAADAIKASNTDAAPWTVLSGLEPASCAWEIGRDIETRLGNALSSEPAKPLIAVATPAKQFRDVLAEIDLTQKLSKSKYQKRLPRYQARLAELHRRAIKREISSVVVFEGWDAAGKGGSIRRITYALDPRQYQAIRVAAPTDEELAHHYLWRFWRHIPRAGHTTIYDRSWYGRVLVERVEDFAKPHRWQQAYDEINDFEQALAEHGTVICKFWLHISPDEQLRRFREREAIPHKHHKITEEDYRNRDKWSAYTEAVNEMVARTDTSWAPWNLIAANDKRYTRVKVLETLCEAFEQYC